MSENQIDRTSFRAIDSLPVRDTALDMIDLAKVEVHIARAVERGRYNGPTNPVEYLKQKGCIAEEGELILATPAGILCFGRQPRRFSRVPSLIWFTIAESTLFPLKSRI